MRWSEKVTVKYLSPWNPSEFLRSLHHPLVLVLLNYIQDWVNTLFPLTKIWTNHLFPNPFCLPVKLYFQWWKVFLSSKKVLRFIFMNCLLSHLLECKFYTDKGLCFAQCVPSIWSRMMCIVGKFIFYLYLKKFYIKKTLYILRTLFSFTDISFMKKKAFKKLFCS